MVRSVGLFVLAFVSVLEPLTTASFTYTTKACIKLVPKGYSGVTTSLLKEAPKLTVSTQMYKPNQEYDVVLTKVFMAYKAFFIQGREKGKNQTAGYFSNTAAELTSLNAQLMNCTFKSDTIASDNPSGTVSFTKSTFKWTSPMSTVRDICFHYSAVEIPNIWFKPKPVCISPDLSTPQVTTSPPTTAPKTKGPTLNTTSTSPLSTAPPTTVPATTVLATTTHPTTTQPVPTTPAPSGQRVKVEPQKLEAIRGKTSQFTCKMLGTPTPVFKEWIRIHDDGQAFTAGVFNPLVISNVQFGDQGKYVCEATALGQTVKDQGELVVKEKPTVTTQPSGVTIVLGKRTTDIIMSCDGIGGHPLSFSWLKDSVKLSGETGRSLTVRSNQSSDGLYHCQISNPYGSTLSNGASVIVHVTPYFVIQPRSYDANAGSMAFFNCKADGNPKPTLHWVKDGMTLNDQKSELLGIANVEMSHEGEYWCEATNVVATVPSQKANLTVITVPPTFDKSPRNTTANYGESFTLNCATHGYPQPKIQWIKNGAILTGRTGGALTVSQLTDSNAGLYSCNATNSIGSTLSFAATVKIYKELPSFALNPLGDRIFVGKMYNFTATASGIPPPTYSWYKDNVVIPGATSSYLVIKKVSKLDGGIYFCRLTNIVGNKDSTKAYLIVSIPPTTEAPTTLVPTTEGPTTMATLTPSSFETEAPTLTGSGTEPETEKTATPTTEQVTSSPSEEDSTATSASTDASETAQDTVSGVPIGAIIGPVFAVLAVIIIILLVLLFVQRRRQKAGHPRRKSGSLDKLVITNEIDHQDDALSSEGDKLPMTAVRSDIKSSADLEQLLGRTPTYIHRISKTNSIDGSALKAILQRVQEHKDNALDGPDEIKKQFEETPSNMVTIQKTPAGTESKNRYMNVLPNPHSAVRLEMLDDDPTTTYVNANYVRGFSRKPKEYIATQGPIPSTRNDFWRMIWEQKVTIIVMSTGLVERGRMKCCRYWPDTIHEDKVTYGDVAVRVIKEDPGECFSITTLAVSNIAESNEGKVRERIITHYWFTAWPDFGIPKDALPVLDFLHIIRKEIEQETGPVLVHCSAGIGRTGTFLAIDMGMQQYDKEKQIDPLMYMCMLRQDRGGSIQTAEQYLFVHEALACYIDSK